MPETLRLVRRHRHGHAGSRGAAQTLHPAKSTASASTTPKKSCRTRTPLSSANVVQLRDRVGRYVPPPDGAPIPAYLGLDIGSVSTNVVVIDESGAVIHDVYLRTAGRPIEAVQQGLTEVERLWGSRLQIRGVGTTGSGRELIAEFVGADVVNDEITAHKTGAIHISNTLGGEPVDTIFEIGGQDSKFISIENGVVVDFAMNEACAAGTGSFLEEQAEKLGISIKDEFARLALAAPAPRAWASAAPSSWSATSPAGCTRAKPFPTWWPAWPIPSRSIT